jgi:hypothetical protein
MPLWPSPTTCRWRRTPPDPYGTGNFGRDVIREPVRGEVDSGMPGCAVPRGQYLTEKNHPDPRTLLPGAGRRLMVPVRELLRALRDPAQR